MVRTNVKTKWTDEELGLLLKEYRQTSNADIAKLLGKTKKSVVRKLKELNLYRTKLEKDLITAIASKKNGRDLTFELVSSIAKMFNTRHEFYLNDKGAYSCAVKNKWLDKICGHMVVNNISLPQLILKSILESLLKEKCSFNDRKVIYPLEIDCYFSKFKIGWEYDGKYFHNDEKDRIKKQICKNNGIILFNIKETTPEYRKYEVNIKNQLKKQINKINKLTGFKLTKNDVASIYVNVEFPNKLTDNEKVIICGKKMSEIKVIDSILFKRIKKYKLYNDNQLNIINDLRKQNRFASIDEFLSYLKNKKYKSFAEMCLYEHPYRLAKRWNVSISIIKKLYE